MYQYATSHASFGSATNELTSDKPDDGAIIAVAGEQGAVWLGLVKCTTHTCVFFNWLEEDESGSRLYPHPTTLSCVLMFLWL